ncbi:MAG TPA: Xaa-Pro peptidase family protein [Burkholderiales bacterium]|nr:Xaa-Pro peptidase family protein [Burkholderiales bacterium]
MSIKRRNFLKMTAGAAGAYGLAAASIGTAAAGSAAGTGAGQARPAAPAKDTPIGRLKPMTAGIVPISDAERLARMEKARRLMAENGLEALIIEGGTGLVYFTDVSWWLSERVLAWVLPARGEMAWVCPKFEEDRARELIRFGAGDVRTWEEDESPYKAIARVLADRGLRTGRIGIEERVRFFVFDGLRKEAPGFDSVSADPVTVGCRSVKSPAEIALIQRANDITVEAYKAAIAMLKEGMSKGDFGANAAAAFRALGAPGGIGASFGEQSSLPHGSIKPRTLREGDVVLMDGGCNVGGYQSDVSRTVVFGRPNQRQREVWELEQRAQLAAFAAAKPGVPHEDVDAAARKVLVAAGYGPGYKLPGLPHRTGHGIGMDGHEWTYLVRGNKAPIRPGMCFTDEPMIVIPGEFGVRLEDDFHVTEDGAAWFTHPSPSIEKPFA